MDGQQASLGQGAMGSGLAQNAAILEQYRPAYMKAAEQAMLQGQEAPPFEQWAAAQHAATQQPQDRRGMLESLFSKVRG